MGGAYAIACIFACILMIEMISYLRRKFDELDSRVRARSPLRWIKAHSPVARIRSASEKAIDAGTPMQAKAHSLIEHGTGNVLTADDLLGCIVTRWQEREHGSALKIWGIWDLQTPQAVADFINSCTYGRKVPFSVEILSRVQKT